VLILLSFLLIPSEKEKVKHSQIFQNSSSNITNVPSFEKYLKKMNLFVLIILEIVSNSPNFDILSEEELENK